MMNELKIFSPATIANISCGFDVLGLALDTIGDEMTIRKVSQKGVRITKLLVKNYLWIYRKMLLGWLL